MKRYRFRLETVLRARRAQEDLARQQLARANQELQRARILVDREVARYEAMPVPAGIVDGAAYRQARAERSLCAGTLAEAARRFEDMAAVADAQRAAWHEAARRVAALERLDGRRRADYAVLATHAEIAEVDDLVTSRFEPASPAPGSGAAAPTRQMDLSVPKRQADLLAGSGGFR